MLTFFLLVWYVIGLISSLFYHSTMKDDKMDLLFCIILAPIMPLFALGALIVLSSTKIDNKLSR